MKLVHITIHFEFTELIESILDEHEIQNFVRYPMVAGKDLDGKHTGTKVFPGHITVFHVHVPEERLDTLLEALRSVKEQKKALQHMEVLVLSVDQHL
jgi:hypothetical protein